MWWMSEVEELQGRSRRPWNLRTRGRSGAQSTKRKCRVAKERRATERNGTLRSQAHSLLPGTGGGSDLTSHRRAHQENRDGGLQRQGELPDFPMASN